VQWLSVVTLTFLIACSSADPLDEDASDPAAAEALSKRKQAPDNGTADLKYEGTCSFLRECSSFSKKLRAPTVQWGCEGAAACDDDELWVAGPTHGHCGKHVRFCKGNKCATALVRDVSVSHDWEASNGVLDKLGIDHAVLGKCSGRGGGQVNVTYPAPADDD
jgi:hypothetical protein